MLLPGQGDVPDADYEAPCITGFFQVRRHPDWILGIYSLFCCIPLPLFLVFFFLESLDRHLNRVLVSVSIHGMDWMRRRSQYLEDLLQEQQKLGAFVQVLPICGRLLNQGER